MRDRRGMLVALATLAVATSPKPARAEPPLTVKLEFRAEDGCPNEQEFLSRLTSRAELRLVAEAEALLLRVWLGVTGSGARGALRAGAEGATDAREVEAASCGEVADALALIAALMIERTKREQASRPTPVAPSSPPPISVAAPKLPPSRRQLHIGLGAVATRPMASAPLTGVGISLFVAGSLTWWLSAQYSRNDALASPGRARFGFGGLVLGAGPPVLNLGSRLQLAAAVAVQGAFLAAEGVDVDVKSSARRSYWAAGALGRAQLKLANHAGVFAEVGGFVPMVERRFSTREPYVLVGQTASVAPHAALGLALSL